MSNDAALNECSTKVHNRIRYKIYDYNFYLKYSIFDQEGNNNLPMKLETATLARKKNIPLDKLGE